MKNRNYHFDKRILKYISETSKNRSLRTRTTSHSVLYQLHLWAKKRDIKISDLTDSNLCSFVSTKSQSSGRSYKKEVRRFLRWLNGEELYVHVQARRFPQWHLKKPDPPELCKFLIAHSSNRSPKTVDNYKYSLRRFHAWLDQGSIKICDVDERHILDFSRALTQYECNSYDAEKGIQQLRIYLHWLHLEGVIRLLDPSTCSRDRKIGSSIRHSLPPVSEQFLLMIGTYLKPATVSNYKATLSHLHFYLKSERVSLIKIKRRHIEGWLIYLEKERLGPVWRRSIIIRTRIYFRWLYEHRKIKVDPDKLLKRSDLPKRPQYLPKPLRPEEDYSLQDRLKTHDELNAKALLLMRWTGVRIGELADLKWDCVWVDHAGAKFLKVPLGKLNNERMVPINEETYQIIKTIQDLSQAHYRPESDVPEKLIYQPSGARVLREQCRLLLHWVAREAGIRNRVNAHRLRHTYATSLLNGGMSLVGVMKLLGHHSMQMTLQYAAVSPEKVRAEYLAAIEKVEDRCQIQLAIEALSNEQAPTIKGTFSDLIRLIQTENRPEMRSLIRRLRKLKMEALEMV